MSTYFPVYYSDPSLANDFIAVQDGDKSKYNTSLTFVGRNASGYSPAIATDFLHLLENFASPEPPSNPIIGQLWFDKANHRLVVNDGTSQTTANWKPVNGVYQQSDQPQGKAGDLSLIHI